MTNVLYDDGLLFVETEDFLGEVWYFLYSRKEVEVVGKRSSCASTNVVDIINCIYVYYRYLIGN